MSVEVELNGKSGRLCAQAAAGTLRCPLIVRQNSEDVVTGTVFGTLRHIRPHLWLGPMLNQAFNTTRFRQVYYRGLSVRFWERQPRFPPELLDHPEGRSEIDLVVEWENEPSTLWVEAKLWSDFATGTTHSDTNDQVLRGVRTLLATTGHIQPDRLFRTTKRKPIWLALLSQKPHTLVEHYRQPQALAKHLGTCCKPAVEGGDMIGTITWGEIRTTVHRNRHWMNITERSLCETLIAYLDLKVAELARATVGVDV